MAEVGDVEVKKRKKKKKVLDLDSMLEGRLETPETLAASQEDAHADGVEDVLDNLEDFGKKKKKKKATKKAEVVEEQVVVTEPVAQEEDDEDLNFGIKKKKKKGKVLDELMLKDQSEETGGDETDIQFDDKETEDYDEIVPCKNVAGGFSAKSWLNSDLDYTYEELLDRAIEIMRAKNPEMASGTKQKFVMRPPQVIRVGTKKSSFVNFMEICKLLHRPHKHLLDFLLSELGTSGSIDGNNQLIIKGRFQQKQIENVLRRYIKEYVTCHTCRSANTLLQKDFRLFFLQCEACGSRCSVAAIKLGFVAQVSKRAVMRAKAT